MTYNYKNKNWESKIDYSFSKYRGLIFLENYFEERKNNLNTINFYLKDNFKKHDYEDEHLVPISTTNQKLIEIINIIENSNRIISDLAFFVKKFELHKKVFDDYSVYVKEGTGSYKNIKNYILLSLACLRAYHISKNLKYINTSLKINDIILSRESKDLEYTDLVKIKEVLKLEMSSIQDLINNE